MNILLVNSISEKQKQLTIGGVEYHRMQCPHVVLKRLYPEYDFLMTTHDHLLEGQLNDILSQTDLVIFSRSISSLHQIDAVCDKLERLNIPFGLDLDDYWHLPEAHISYRHYKEFKTAEYTEKSIQRSHFVTCTTPILAEEIMRLNKNVYVIENGIDTETWTQNKKPSNRLRFGFTQGNTHYNDIKLISDSVVTSLRDSEFYDKAQVVLAGYQQEARKGLSVQTEIECLLTDNLRAIKKEKIHYKQLRNLSMAEKKKYSYRRVWSKDVFEFHKIYDEIDVSVVPLEVNKFNSCKSELKMLEAGFKDCAVMVSHVNPYTILATDKNSFDLNKKSFYEWSKYLLRNPNALADSKAQLREDVERHDLKHLTEKRHNLYKQFKKQKVA